MYTEFYERELTSPVSRKKFDDICEKIELHLPKGSTRKKPKIFICNTAANMVWSIISKCNIILFTLLFQNKAEILKAQIESLPPTSNYDLGYECVLLHSPSDLVHVSFFLFSVILCLTGL